MKLLSNIREFFWPLLEKNEIEKAIKIYGKSKKGIELAAAMLGISRATIYRKLKE